MALPKLNLPKYKLKLPSDGSTVNFRPFLVKEEKLLLMATEMGEQEDIMSAITKIIEDCTDIPNVAHLSTFDIEFVFLQIRQKSVGENVKVNVTCPDDGETSVEVEIPLADIKVQKDRKHKTEIKLGDGIILTMGYPNLDTFVEMNFTDGNPGVEQIFEVAAKCMVTIADENQLYDCKDSSKEELLEFLDGLTSTQFKSIQEFFETMPKLKHTVKVINPKTEVENEIVLEGLSAFFA